MTALLSIVVLSYKNDELLYETLESIFFQTYGNIELIISDDCSPNFKIDLIEQYIKDNKSNNISSYRILTQEKNVGTVRNLNHAITASNGVYIKAIAGDDTFASRFICEKQIDYLEKHQDIMLVASNTIECNEKMEAVSASGFLLDDDLNPVFMNRQKLLKYIVRYNPKALATQTICYRRSFFTNVGLFDEGFCLIEDLPKAVEIVEKGIRIGYLNEFGVNHRGKTGISTSDIVFDPNRMQYYKDLELYFSKTLYPIRKQVGAVFVVMRHKVCKFRLEYCNLKPDNKIGKIKLFMKYSVPLSYYILTRYDRVRMYVGKGK